MSTFVLLALATVFVLLVLQSVRASRSAPTACPAPRPALARPPARGPARKAARHLPPLDLAIPAPPPLAGDALTHRLRERYAVARFPGVITDMHDLANEGRLIRCARLYFEEDAADRAMELLALAIEESPRSAPLRLAQLEIAFLARASGRFTALARDFLVHPAAAEYWPEVARLGRALSPDEPLFADATGERAHEHYGPWPDLPNWIQASWDLTPEVLAAEFHRAVLRETNQSPSRQRLATGA